MFKRLLLLGTFLLVCVTLASQKKPPLMVFRERVKELGTVPVKDSTTVIFHYRNDAERPITLVGAHPSCKCVVPSYSREPLMPGDSTSFSVRYKPSHAGAFSYTVTLSYAVEGSQEPEIVRVGFKGTASEKPCTACAE